MGNEILWAIVLGILCIAAASYTSVLSWLVPSTWCVLYLFMWRMPPTPSGIQDLLLAVMMLFALATSLALFRLRLWNLKARNPKRLLLAKCIWVLLCLLLLVITLAQTEVLAYLSNVWNEGGFFAKLLHILSIPCLFFILYRTGELFFCLVDRIIVKKRPFTLISCKIIQTPGLIQRYYLTGIHNGKTYHYRITERTYRKIKKIDALTLEIKEGLLGGRYVTAVPKQASKKT